MSPWKAALPGDHLDQIDTPALILNLDAFERNMQRLQDALSGTGVRLRPHAKSHKCPDIALYKQLVKILLSHVGIALLVIV